MADDTAKIQSRYQDFLTQQEDTSRFMNSDFPTGEAVKFIQFCALMGAPEDKGGFGLAAFNTIADQASAIMVSRNRQGRQEVAGVSSAITMQKNELWRYGPQGRPAEEPEPQKGRRK